jgi:ferredoxin-NADP reductase
MVEMAVTGLPRPRHYIAGTPDMREAMLQTLNEMGLADADIHSEDFTATRERRLFVCSKSSHSVLWDLEEGVWGRIRQGLI